MDLILIITKDNFLIKSCSDMDLRKLNIGLMLYSDF